MGVKKGASRVDTAVTESDSARLARARNDKTLDARPLGQQPARITPAAISFGKLKIKASVKPRTA